jgi:hypothetical protein
MVTESTGRVTAVVASTPLASSETAKAGVQAHANSIRIVTKSFMINPQTLT